jgi:hypothetical protein
LRTECDAKRMNVRELCRDGQALGKREVKDMLTKITENDKSTVVFKVKNHIKSDITSNVLNSVLDSFRQNTVCEALYLQNLGLAMQDEQIVKLIELLQYCTVPGDSRPPSNPGVTGRALGAEDSKEVGSESVRARHPPVAQDAVKTCHRCRKAVDRAFPERFWCQAKSSCRCRPIWCINVGECDYVSMGRWKWFCEQLQYTSVTHMYVSEHIISADLKTRMRDVIRCNRSKHRFHNDEHNIAVIQRCTNCWWNPINSLKHAEINKANQKIWAEEERLRKKQEARDEARRVKEAARAKELARLQKIEDRRLAKEAEREALRRATLDVSALDETHVEYWYYRTHRPDLIPPEGGAAKGKGKKRKAAGGGTGESEPVSEAARLKAEGYWRFECSCGEVCTSYENYRYHPTGLMYECADTDCFHWAHAKCVFGQKTTQATLDSMGPAYCPKCISKRRRNARPDRVSSSATVESTDAVEPASVQHALGCDH